MKFVRCAFLILMIWAVAYPQSENLGMGTFSNDKAPISMVIDASLVNAKMDSPYVMFMAFMMAKDSQTINVDRNDVVMVYKGQEYHMPSLKELREKYPGQRSDIDLYRHLGKEGVIASQIRFYKFAVRNEFFPIVGLEAPLVTDVASFSSNIGFKTKFYFKNPGFQKGDQLLIKVKDRKNPQIAGEVEVVLK